MKEVLFWLVKSKPKGDIIEITFLPIYGGKRYKAEDFEYVIGKSFYPIESAIEKYRDAKYVKRWLKGHVLITICTSVLHLVRKTVTK